MFTPEKGSAAYIACAYLLFTLLTIPYLRTEFDIAKYANHVDNARSLIMEPLVQCRLC